MHSYIFESRYLINILGKFFHIYIYIYEFILI